MLNQLNANIFWAAQFAIVLFWTILTLVNVIMMSMFWTSLAVFGFLLSAINLYCYFKCRGGNYKVMKNIGRRLGRWRRVSGLTLWSQQRCEGGEMGNR